MLPRVTKSVHLPLELKGGHRLTGPEALARAWNRYGIKKRESGIKSIPKESEKLDGNVPSNSEANAGTGDESRGGEQPEPAGTNGSTKVDATDVGRDLCYTVPVRIGTPGVIMNMIVDTSSTQFWVVSSKYKQDEAFSKGVHSVYDPEASASAEKQVGKTWGSLVGEGTEARGEVYVDKVTIGSVSIPRQTIEVARLFRRGVFGSGCDGVLGLGIGHDNHVLQDGKRIEVDSVFDNMQGLLDSPIFSANLTKGGAGSFYTFGSIDKGITSRALQFTHVMESELGAAGWQFASTAWTLDGVKMRRGPGTSAIADTGTSLILLDDEMCEAIYAKIPGAVLSPIHNGWIFPRVATPPALELAVGSALYAVRAPSFVYDGIDSGEVDGSEMAYGSIQSNGGSQVLAFGDAFFHSVYVVFDYGQKRIGCAPKLH